MRGNSHALSGAAGWYAVTTSSQLALNYHHTPPSVAILGALLTAGAAMVPDVDTIKSTIAYALPPLTIHGQTIIPSPTMALCKVVGKASGGHRHATHSTFGIIAATGIAVGIALIRVPIHGRDVALGSGLLALFLTALAVKALRLSSVAANAGSRSGLLGKEARGLFRSWAGPWLLALSCAGYVTWFLHYSWGWLPASMALGCLIHCLGDGLTTQGWPILWPWHPAPPKVIRRIPGVHKLVSFVWQDNGYFRFPILGDTGSRREKMFAFLLFCYVVYMTCLQVGVATGHPVLP